MLIYPKKNSTMFFLDYWHWHYYQSPWWKASNLHVTWIIVISSMLMITLVQNQSLFPKNKSCINYSALDPLLFEKLHNIKLSCSVFRVTTFFQFDTMKVGLSILLHYAHSFNKNLKTLYSKIVTVTFLIVKCIMTDNTSCLTLLYLN